MGKKGLPHDWIGCPTKGDHLVDSTFLIFKTPLSKKYDNKLSQDQRFYPEDVFLTEDKKPGLWIDLTNTDRYYPRKAIEEQDCIYEKLNCDGHGRFPTKTQINHFIDMVQNFLRNADDKSVAVHCTHGFNRTGFMVVSYLVKVHDYNVSHAVEMFANARPPGIYRQNYIQELFKIYGRPFMTLPPIPTPYWIEGFQAQKSFNSRKRSYEFPPYGNGPNRNAPNRNGPYENDPYGNGSWRNNPSRNGPNRNGPYENDPYGNGPSRNNNPSRNGPNRNGPYENDPYGNGPSRSNPSRSGTYGNDPYGNRPSYTERSYDQDEWQIQRNNRRKARKVPATSAPVIRENWRQRD